MEREEDVKDQTKGWVRGVEEEGEDEGEFLEGGEHTRLFAARVAIVK